MIETKQTTMLTERTKNMKVPSIVAVRVLVGISITKSVKVMHIAMKKKKALSFK